MANTSFPTTNHTFTLPSLAQHFEASPIPDGADRLIELPKTQFLETEEEVNVIAGAVWGLCVEYDRLGEREWAKDKSSLKKWLNRNVMGITDALLYKIDPPFNAFTADLIYRDVLSMTEDLLVKTLPPPKPKTIDAKTANASSGEKK